jgi:hypothetical protein
MTRIIKDYKKDVNEKARMLYNKVGFNQTKRELHVFILDSYLEAQNSLKETQEKYCLYGIMDYYKLQYRLLTCFQELSARTDEQWTQSIRTKQSIMMNR